MFHYAFKVINIESTKKFYIDILGCALGRFSDTWVDFNFFGHQLSAHVDPKQQSLDYCGQVDGIKVPVPHFGCILDPEQFEEIGARLKMAKVDFVVKPYTRYQGQIGEQQTLFVLDFSGNALEFKSFTRPEEIWSS